MKLAKIVNIERSTDRCYDLTVENNHNFFCNDVLIHNCDYRGVVKVILHNVGSSTFTVNKGDRIAQLVITPIIRASFSHSRELPETARGAGGFGSTGTLTDLYLGLCVDYSSTSLHKVLNGRKINAKTHFDCGFSQSLRAFVRCVSCDERQRRSHRRLRWILEDASKACQRVLTISCVPCLGRWWIAEKKSVVFGVQDEQAA